MSEGKAEVMQKPEQKGPYVFGNWHVPKNLSDGLSWLKGSVLRGFGQTEVETLQLHDKRAVLPGARNFHERLPYFM